MDDSGHLAVDENGLVFTYVPVRGPARVFLFTWEDVGEANRNAILEAKGELAL